MRRFNITAVCGWRAALAGCGPATTLLEAGHTLAPIAANMGIKDFKYAQQRRKGTGEQW
jgi:hypothetical protein